MKKQLATMILLLATCSFLVIGCGKDDGDDDDTSVAASFVIGSTSYTVTNPTLGIFNDGGTIKNTMTLKAEDGSEIVFHFTGSSPSTYILQSYSDAYYKDAAGKQYNSTSGELIVSSYSTTNSTYKATGTFHFKAKTFTAPIDSLEITAGVFTNASN